MASHEERERHAKRRKRNVYAKSLRDNIRLYGPRIVEEKNLYKREKLDLKRIEEEEEFE